MNTTFHLVLAGIWLVFLVYWAASSIHSKRNVRGTYQKTVVPRIIAMVVVIGILQVPGLRGFFVPQGIFLNPIINSIGLVLTALGVGFAIWARRHIGTNWGMPMSVKEKPELVASGPYKLVRHPIYSGILLAILGSTLVVDLGWFVMFVLFSVYFIYSAKREEGIMLAEFPLEYADYKRCTKMLIPHVW